MDLSNILGNLAEWVAAVGAIATAVIVYLQIRDLRKTVQNQAYQAVYNEMLSLDRFFFQNSEFREFFYEGKEPPPEKIVQARIVAELLCDLADYVYLQSKTMKPEDFRQWQTYTDDLYETSPVFRDVLAKRKGWYDHRVSKATRNEAPTPENR